MEGQAPVGDQGAITQAQATIARQVEEIQSLRQQLAAAQAAVELREVLSLAAVAGTITAPVTYTELLQLIVETAAHVISAEAASLFLVDEVTHELFFEVALGPNAEEVKRFRVPPGHGIAGLVAMTGQPMAVADASNDPRTAMDIAQSINHTPDSILCVPLISNDEVLGVLELLDKRGTPTFTPWDMQVLGFFAKQAAVTIQQSQARRDMVALVCEAMVALGAVADVHAEQVRKPARVLAETLEQDGLHRHALGLAELVREIAKEGEGELAACHAILHSFADYLRLRRAAVGAPH